MLLKYLLDTNICIYIAKQKPLSVLHKFEHLSVGSVGMSVITYGELVFGAQKSVYPKKTIQLLEELVDLIPVLPMSIEVGKRYGQIRSELEKQGKLIGNNDIWIAAHALVLHVKLVTNNMKEFLRVPHLVCENWV